MKMKIKKITKLAPEITVDIEVANTHSYQLDNGVVSHNTVSQLVDSASGIHARYSQYYIRTVRQDKKDPLGQFLKDAGIPCEDDVTKPEATWVFSFPQKAPETAVFRNDMTAIEQLEHYMVFKKNWCEHNPSITVYVRENEWLEVGSWVYKNFDDIGGVSFLPHSDHSYRQAPYQEVDKATYEALLAKMPNIDWDSFAEVTDNVEGAQTLACSAGGCEIL
jgi:ribonucleoside-diphosphate reductase alpha chain